MLFVARSIAHFSYYESVLAALLERGAALEVAFDERWSRKWSGGDQNAVREFTDTHPALTTSWSVRRSDKHRDRIFALRELRSYRSYLTRAETTPFYVERWRGYLTEDWKVRTGSERFRRLLRTAAAGLALKLAEDLTPPDAGVLDFLRDKAPDVVVVSPLNMRFSEEIDYVKAARRLGIPTALPVLSWDNLSTKGLIQIVPDKVFVWNQHQYEDAVQIHGLAPAKLVVAGAPFFDKWFGARAEITGREAFCAQLGFDPAKKILLYLGSSRNIAVNETWFVGKLMRWLRDSKDPNLRDCQLLLRPHPANAKIYERLDAPGLRVFPEGGALPETREDFAQMRDSFFHADAALGINTSGMIDAVLAGLPTFSVRIERYAATQSDSKHFRYLEADEALYLADDLKGFCRTLAGVFGGQDPRADARRAFSRKFARPEGLERSAGDVVAEGVLQLALERRR